MRFTFLASFVYMQRHSVLWYDLISEISNAISVVKSTKILDLMRVKRFAYFKYNFKGNFFNSKASENNFLHYQKILQLS